MVNGGLSPKAVTVQIGTTVTWSLTDGGKHRIRSTAGPTPFDSGGLNPGASFTVTFDALGTSTYRDDENKNVAAYNGVITVVAQAPPGGGGGTTPTPTPTTASVNIANRAFAPASISVITGATVVWSNNDKDPHTVSQTGGGFNSGTFGTGASYRRTFPTAGTFQYFCEIHPSMLGVVAVSSREGLLPSFSRRA